MTERSFRLFQGLTILILMYIGNQYLMYAFLGMLFFEGVTNWRIPKLISKLRYGKDYVADTAACGGGVRFSFDAERMFRLMIGLVLTVSYVFLPDLLWFFPWFVGFMLTSAGVTGVCPMVIVLKYIGFR